MAKVVAAAGLQQLALACCDFIQLLRSGTGWLLGAWAACDDEEGAEGNGHGMHRAGIA